MDGNETGVDCGGPDCPPCPPGQGCLLPRDCQSMVCENGICQAPTCSDGVQNGDETDIDCGGPVCQPCPPGEGCLLPRDCTSSVCGAMICDAPTCSDGVKNGDESDVDCGGDVCVGCGGGETCRDGADCLSGICQPDGLCETPKNVIADDGLWVWRGKFRVNWRAHEQGKLRDSLKVRGWINPGGLRRDMSGVTLELQVGGQVVVSGLLNSKGKYRTTGPSGERIKATIDPKRGVYLFQIKKGDLRGVLPVNDMDPGGLTVLPLVVSVSQADTKAISNRAQFAFTLVKGGKQTKGKFKAARERLLDGVFIVKKVRAKFSGGRDAYRLQVAGWLTLDDGAVYVPDGDITIGLGGFDGVVPFADVRRKGIDDLTSRWKYKDKSNDVRLFDYNAKSLRVKIKSGWIPAATVDIVPMPPDDRTADLPVRITSPIVGGRLRATSVVELVRKRATSNNWKRPGPVP